jgi:hypothetical protein
MEEAASLYPVTLEVDYPERQSRWKTLLRLFLLFEIDEQAQPTEFHYWSPPTETRRVIWEFK